MRPIPSSNREPPGDGRPPGTRPPDVLDHPVRRRIVGVLARQEAPMPVATLVDEFLVGASAPLHADQLPNTRRHLYVLLDDRHLPALADAGLVRRDPVADTVALTHAGRSVGRSLA